MPMPIFFALLKEVIGARCRQITSSLFVIRLAHLWTRDKRMIAKSREVAKLWRKVIRRWLVICSVTFLVKLFWMSIKWCWYIIEICKFIWSNSPLDNTIVSSTSWSQTLSLSHKYPWKKCPCVHLPLTINLIQTNGNQLMNCFGWWRPRQPLLQTTKKKWLRAPRHYNYPQDKKKICN